MLTGRISCNTNILLWLYIGCIFSSTLFVLSDDIVHQCGDTETYCPNKKPCCQSKYSPSGYGCLDSSSSSSLTTIASDCMNDDDLDCMNDDGKNLYRKRKQRYSYSGIIIKDHCCKPGPPLPPSTNLPNCLILGDSVSIGYTPFVIDTLQTICQVQHGPWDISDGGAESSNIGVQCLDNFVVTQNQTKINWDIILFNFGLHDIDEGENSGYSYYSYNLLNITKRLLLLNNNNNIPKLIYATTTPYMPKANEGNMIVDYLNDQAIQVMKNVEQNFFHNRIKIRILDLNKLIHDHCGILYQSCDWCNTDPCSYHYNEVGKRIQGIFVAAAITEELLSLSSAGENKI